MSYNLSNAIQDQGEAITMDRVFRSVYFIVAITQALLGLGFALQITFITQIWPLPNTSPLSLIFIGSIFMAAAASTLWCLFFGENGSLAGVNLDYIAIFAPLTIYFFMIANGNGTITMFGVVLLLGTLYGALGL